MGVGKVVSEQPVFNGTEAEYRALAKRYYHDEGVIEIDDGARIAQGASSGAYVEAWVWVDNPAWDGSFEEQPTPKRVTNK